MFIMLCFCFYAQSFRVMDYIIPVAELVFIVLCFFFSCFFLFPYLVSINYLAMIFDMYVFGILLEAGHC